MTEILEGAGNAAVWRALAYRDIRARYRRTVLGPIWIVIFTIVSAAMIALVYGVLLNRGFLDYFAFVVASIVSWTLIAGVLSEAASLFWLSGTLMKTFQLSPVVLLLANLWKNLIVWCHAIVPALACAAVLQTGELGAVALLPVGLALVALNLGWMSFVVAMIGARFRDVHELVLTAMALAFLITPVIWEPRMLGEYRALADFNPLAHLLDLVRRPAMGLWPSPVSFLVATLGATMGWLIVAVLFARVRSRIPLWV